MMEYIFRLFLTLNSLLISLMVFLIKEQIVINSLHPPLSNLPNIITYMLYFDVILIITWLSIHFTNYLSVDTISSISVIEPANDAFLPSYLGYFFVALSVPNFELFLVVFGIICIFIFHSRISYFNPIFFLFGFNFYYIITNKSAKVLLITQKQLKDPRNVAFNNLKRINNYTFVDVGR